MRLRQLTAVGANGAGLSAIWPLAARFSPGSLLQKLSTLFRGANSEVPKSTQTVDVASVLKTVSDEAAHNPETALRAWHAAREFKPDDTAVLLKLSALYLAQGDVVGAKRHIEQILDNDGSHAEALALREFIDAKAEGRSYMLAGIEEGARRNFDKMRTLYAQAQEPLERALSLNAESVPVRNFLIQSLCEQGKFEEAKGHIEAALQEDEHSVPALCAKGRILIVEDKLSEAMEVLNKAKVADPKAPDPDFWLSFVYQGMAEVQEKSGHLKWFIGDEKGSPGAQELMVEALLSAVSADQKASSSTAEGLKMRQLAQIQASQVGWNDGMGELSRIERLIPPPSTEGLPKTPSPDVQDGWRRPVNTL